MHTTIDPKIDFAFKWLFGQERNIPLLIHLLNSILKPAQSEEIVEVELLNPYNAKESIDDKLSIVDIKARDCNGRHFTIEMQLNRAEFFTNRILFYWARVHKDQLNEGDRFGWLKPTISICFVNFELFPKENGYHHIFELREKTTNRSFSSDLMVIVFELSKFKLNADDILSTLDAWLYFLCNSDILISKSLPPQVDRPEIRKALEELAMLSNDELEKQRYEARFRVLLDERSRIEDTREVALELGLVQGRMEVVLELLAQRLGPIPENVVKQLNQITAKQTKQLTNSLLSLENLEDLSGWLKDISD